MLTVMLRNSTFVLFGVALLGGAALAEAPRLVHQRGKVFAPEHVALLQGESLRIGNADPDVVYTIDPKTGAATRVSKLKTAFAAGGRAVVDFNPQADRLRLLGSSGISYRVNVDDGAVILDGMLKYDGKDTNAGRQPFVTAAAYTNAMPNAKGTELIDLDLGARVLALQSPPNDGVLQSRGKLGSGIGPDAAFDILLDANQDNIGFVLSAGVLHRIDLDSGNATRLGKVANLPAVTDIAVQPAK